MLTIGGYTLFPVPASRFRLDGGAMFGVVPKVLWSRTHPADEENRVEMVSRCLLVVGEGRVVLVNTGMGTNWSEKERSIYCLDPAVDLLRSLASLGYTPEQVTHVILTHLHFDHAGGNTQGGQTAPLRPGFPNAEFLVQRGHIEWARAPSERDRASFVPGTWETLMQGGRLRLVDGAQELFPGISVELVHGHTPYQQLPRISDGTTTLLHGSDLVPFASQVRIPWVMGFDLRPVDTVGEKRRLLGEAVRGGWTLFLEHDPRYECCRVEESDRGLVAAQAGEL